MATTKSTDSSSSSHIANVKVKASDGIRQDHTAHANAGMAAINSGCKNPAGCHKPDAGMTDACKANGGC